MSSDLQTHQHIPSLRLLYQAPPGHGPRHSANELPGSGEGGKAQATLLVLKADRHVGTVFESRDLEAIGDGAATLSEGGVVVVTVSGPGASAWASVSMGRSVQRHLGSPEPSRERLPSWTMTFQGRRRGRWKREGKTLSGTTCSFPSSTVQLIVMDRPQAPSLDSDSVKLVASTAGIWDVNFTPSDKSCGRPIHFQVVTLRPEGPEERPPALPPLPTQGPPTPPPTQTAPAEQAHADAAPAPGVDRAEPDAQLSPGRVPEPPAAQPGPAPPAPFRHPSTPPARQDSSSRAGSEADGTALQHPATPKSSGPSRVHWTPKTPSKPPSRSTSNSHANSPLTVSDSEPSQGSSSSSPSHSEKGPTTPQMNALASAGCSIQVEHYLEEHDKRLNEHRPKRKGSEASGRTKGKRADHRAQEKGNKRQRV
ncbi:hypothetical protein BV25DRAFT_1922140 [Artomyces pyxidatus]|uniref:Uncharacterized protein n=1 Tax=Artomyces pyxidatus TaxID=48021 RepID=A0ACB8SES0_9AGAM|nr:hypothetical protein BV25DRAFT_1922140 [Artomyces pyxidatus]